MPKQLTVNGSTHNYTYTADGRKLKVVQGTNNRDYAGNIIYENGSLKRILFEGGYIEGGEYYFYLKDHLGNVRVVANSSGTAIQRNHYYPFGMPFAETANSDQDKQPYKYNGNEFDRKDGLNLYDYSARYMDPAIARFTTMDPLAEKYCNMSPYAYCANNPVKFVDPDGMTHYVMDMDGYVSLKRDLNGALIGTYDNYDLLFIGASSVRINDRGILPDLMKTRNDFNGHYAKTKSIDDAANLFHFAATHTNVEWAFTGFRMGGRNSSNMYVVGTSHEKGTVDNTHIISGFSELNQIFDIHSHPGEDGTRGASDMPESSVRINRRAGDMKRIINRYNRFLDAGMKHPDRWFQKDGQWRVFPKHYVYHPYSGNLYNYTPWNSSIFTRHINTGSDIYRNMGF